MQGDDGAAEHLLDQVVREWTAAGVLPTVRRIVDEVWRDNLRRLDPALGDDAQVLGLQSSLNLRNRVVAQFARAGGATATVLHNALVLAYAGRLLHAGKAPNDRLGWDVHSIDWASSDVRTDAAARNSAAYRSTQGTLFDGDRADPTGLRDLHLTWLGTPGGATAAWVGFPRLGGRPWYAVTRLDG